ncbi:MAG: glutathione S-transferase family protein [Burkholderiales bacterium]|nr:glutathione S-transferase family protein [Burkholderiales bacterium]
MYGYQGSGSAAVEAALELLRLPYERVNAASWDDTSQRDALRQHNPLLQIPSLQWEDGSGMTESAAILIELALRHPASGLLPADPARRAQAIRGLVYVAANCYAMIGVIDYPDRVMDSPSKAEADRVRARSRARLHELWDRFADQFAATPWLGGQAIGALDLLATVVSKWSGSRAHLAVSRPALSALFARVEAHPAVSPVFARHWPVKA